MTASGADALIRKLAAEMTAYFWEWEHETPNRHVIHEWINRLDAVLESAVRAPEAEDRRTRRLRELEEYWREEEAGAAELANRVHYGTVGVTPEFIANLRAYARENCLRANQLKAVLDTEGDRPMKPQQEQIAWLVALGSSTPQWWTGRGDEWTDAVDGTLHHRAKCAMRFARKEDAERAIGWLVKEGTRDGCKAEEHIWLDTRADTEGDRQEPHAEPDERFVPVPVPQGDGRHDIGDAVRAAIVNRLMSEWTHDPDLTPKKIRELAMWAGASVRALLHELGTLRDLVNEDDMMPEAEALMLNRADTEGDRQESEETT